MKNRKDIDSVEDGMELSKQTKRNIRKAEKEIKERKFKTLEQVRKELGLKK